MKFLSRFVKKIFFIIVVIVIYNVIIVTVLFWVGSWSFEHSLANGYTIHRSNFSDIHIAGGKNTSDSIVVLHNYNDIERQAISNVPIKSKNGTSIVVPPKIVLLTQNGDIVYGINVSVRQKFGPSKGLPSTYFGWFVLDTKKRKCWLGLTLKELDTILNDYQIERLPFYKRRYQRWEINYNFIDNFLMYVKPTLLTIVIIFVCKILLMVFSVVSMMYWAIQRRVNTWLGLTGID